MIKPMTDDEVIAHLTDMADVNYKATDILIKRVKQYNRMKEILMDESISQMYEHEKLMEVINE